MMNVVLKKVVVRAVCLFACEAVVGAAYRIIGAEIFAEEEGVTPFQHIASLNRKLKKVRKAASIQF